MLSLDVCLILCLSSLKWETVPIFKSQKTYKFRDQIIIPSTVCLKLIWILLDPPCLWQIQTWCIFIKRKAKKLTIICIHTPPIISKCSCLLKSIALPLKNHLKMGLRDESLDTSQGNTMLCPTLASKLKGGTMIFVGSWGEKHIDLLLYAARCRYQPNE